MSKITAAAGFGLLCCWPAAAFVVQTGSANRQVSWPVQVEQLEVSQMRPTEDAWTSATVSVAPLLAGMCLGLAAFIVSPRPAFAGAIEEVPIVTDAKGSTTNLTKEQLGRGKRLFNAACSTCHVGGGTRTNQNVGLDLESLQGARPRRDNVEGLVDYLNNPTTYDGLVDISEVHPSMKAAKVWPKMRFMKQQDLVDISSYIMYETQVITEKWGGGKIYY